MERRIRRRVRRLHIGTRREPHEVEQDRGPDLCGQFEHLLLAVWAQGSTSGRRCSLPSNAAVPSDQRQVARAAPRSRKRLGMTVIAGRGFSPAAPVRVTQTHRSLGKQLLRVSNRASCVNTGSDRRPVLLTFSYRIAQDNQFDRCYPAP